MQAYTEVVSNSTFTVELHSATGAGKAVSLVYIQYQHSKGVRTAANGVMQEVEDLERQLRLMSDNAAAVAAANGIRQMTLNDKGRSNKISAQSIARKVCASGWAQ